MPKQATRGHPAQKLGQGICAPNSMRHGGALAGESHDVSIWVSGRIRVARHHQQFCLTNILLPLLRRLLPLLDTKVHDTPTASASTQKSHIDTHRRLHQRVRRKSRAIRKGKSSDMDCIFHRQNLDIVSHDYKEILTEKGRVTDSKQLVREATLSPPV